jgi:hypothetical protein
MNARIQQYRFTDSKAGITTIAAIHFACALVFFAFGNESLRSIVRAQTCLITAILFALLCLYYDWKGTTNNLLVIVVFIAGLVIEWQMLGIPEAPMTMSSKGYSKGFATTFIMQMLPWFYAGLRVLCVLLIFHITREAYRLKSMID